MEQITKLPKCVVCGFETNPMDTEELYCSACGSPLFNECTNYECRAELSPTAAYCKYCGSASTFLNLNVVESKKPEFPISFTFEDDDIPF